MGHFRNEHPKDKGIPVLYGTRGPCMRLHLAAVLFPILGSVQALNGMIDEVRLYDRILSAAEILALAQ